MLPCVPAVDRLSAGFLAGIHQMTTLLRLRWVCQDFRVRPGLSCRPESAVEEDTNWALAITQSGGEQPTNQNTEQLSSQIRPAVLGNAGTLTAFRVSAADAELNAPQFYRLELQHAVGDTISTSVLTLVK